MIEYNLIDIGLHHPHMCGLLREQKSNVSKKLNKQIIHTNGSNANL